jgi:DivIVA domain-containing protein
MTLTPSDIEQKTFSTALRGYNLDEVDDFLDEVVRSMRKLHEELETARSDLETRGAEVDDSAELAPAATAVPTAVAEPPPTPPPVAPIDESAVGKALIAAQETAERIVTDARSEADAILVRAQSEAETFEESRLQRKEEADREISRIDGLVNRVKSELADLSVAVGAELDEMTEAIDTAITDLDNSPGDQAESGDDLDTGDESVSGDPDGENIVVAADASDGTHEIPEASGGRRRHRSEIGETDGDDDSDSEDDTDSDDDSEEDYFNFPEGEDEDEDDEDEGDEDEDEDDEDEDEDDEDDSV